MRTVFPILTAVLLLSGCAAHKAATPTQSPAKPKEAPPLQLDEKDVPEASPPAAAPAPKQEEKPAGKPPTLTIGLPPGWEMIANDAERGVVIYANMSKQSALVVAVRPAATTPLKDAVELLRNAIRLNGAVVDPTKVYGDRHTFSWRKDAPDGKTSGKVVVKIMPELPDAVVMMSGEWPSAIDAEVSAEFDAVDANMKWN